MKRYEKLEICKGDFYYFNYALKERNEPTGRLVNFFDELNMPKIFQFYGQIENEKICLIEELQKTFNFSTFFCYLCYYIIFSKKTKIYYVSDSKSLRALVDKIIDITFYVKDFTELNATYSEINKAIMFSNGGQINFFTDITYDFRNQNKVVDLLVFDNAAMKNFDKLTYTIESIINGQIANKAIINFNFMPPIFYGSENFNYLITEFKNHIKLVKQEKW